MLALPGSLPALLPGAGLALAVTAAACGLEAVETALFGRAWLEALVLAILLGTLERSLVLRGPRWQPGARFAAKLPLEAAWSCSARHSASAPCSPPGRGCSPGSPGSSSWRSARAS